MRVLYTLTVFVGSFLLFLVEPMVAKLLLPRFGGSAGVWTTSLVFFQAALLAGYGFAHLSHKWLAGNQRWLQLALLLLVLVTLPLQLRVAGSENSPVSSILLTLALTVGLPFFALSSMAPTLQKWFASTDDPQSENPYFLYAASNIGSLLGLFAYPLLLEPTLSLKLQRTLWSYGWIPLFLLTLVCVARSNKSTKQEEAVARTDTPTSKQRWRWIALAAAPSSLLLGVTTYLTTNVAPIPLLWAVPLALYLVTFIVAFARKKIVSAASIGRWLPLLATPLALAIVLESSEPILPLAIFHLATVFIASLACHALLAEERPDASHLTEYFFWISFGGVVGGLFNAVVAPLLFHSLAEYPIGLVAACMLAPTTKSTGPTQLGKKDLLWPVAVGLITAASVAAVLALGMAPTPVRTLLTIGAPAILCFLASDRHVRFGLSLGALFLVSSIFHTASDGTVVFAGRSFYGVHRIVDTLNPSQRKLVHGNTTHGVQNLDSQTRDEPLTYYSRSGPAGELFKAFSGPLAKKHVGLVGLGVGSLASYGQPGQTMTFFEIDPVVREVADDPKWFTFLHDSKAAVNIIEGDGRLTVAREPESKYGILVLDAFSSDSIPVHLLTEEAIRMYLSKLEPDGIMAFHISNRYLDLAPVLGADAQDLGLVAKVEEDAELSDAELQAGKTASVWLIMARKQADFGPMLKVAGWTDVPIGKHPWTDDFSNVLSAFKVHRD